MIKEVVGGLASGGVSAAGSALSSIAGSALNYKYQKKLMAEQEKYNQKHFEQENARQDYLMKNTPQIQRNALANAGYNTADPNGTGVQTPANNSLGAVSQPSFSSQPMDLNPLNNMLSILSLKKLNSEKEGQDLSNQFNRETMKDREKAVSLNNDLIQKNIQQIDTTIQNINQDTELKREQKRQITQSILNLEGQLETIKINNKWLDQINEKSLAKLEKEVDNIQAMTNKTKSEKLYQDYVNGFAKFGMFVGNDFLSNLQFISTSKHADKLVKDFGSTLKQAFQESLNETSGVSDYIKNKVVSLWDKFCAKFGF